MTMASCLMFLNSAKFHVFASCSLAEVWLSFADLSQPCAVSDESSIIGSLGVLQTCEKSTEIPFHLSKMIQGQRHWRHVQRKFREQRTLSAMSIFVFSKVRDTLRKCTFQRLHRKYFKRSSHLLYHLLLHWNVAARLHVCSMINCLPTIRQHSVHKFQRGSVPRQCSFSLMRIASMHLSSDCSFFPGFSLETQIL